MPQSLLWMACALAVSTVLAALMYRFFERPVLRLRDRLTGPTTIERAPPPAAAGAGPGSELARRASAAEAAASGREISARRAAPSRRGAGEARHDRGSLKRLASGPRRAAPR